MLEFGACDAAFVTSSVFARPGAQRLISVCDGAVTLQQLAVRDSVFLGRLNLYLNLASIVRAVRGSGSIVFYSSQCLAASPACSRKLYLQG